MNSTVCKTSEFAPVHIAVRDGKTFDLTALPRRLIAVLYAWQQRSVDRMGLQSMSDHMLADIGIDRVEAWQEADKPFWKS